MVKPASFCAHRRILRTMSEKTLNLLTACKPSGCVRVAAAHGDGTNFKTGRLRLELCDIFWQGEKNAIIAGRR